MAPKGAFSLAELALHVIARSSALLLYHLRDDAFQVIDVPCALFWGHPFSPELVKVVEKLLFHLRLDEFSDRDNVSSRARRA